MGSSPSSNSQFDHARAAAESLAQELACGGVLPVLPGVGVLASGELIHGELIAEGWRFQALDVVVEQRRLLAMGGLRTFGIAAAANSIGNRRALAEGRRLAAPQWRQLGNLQVLATNQRLLVLHEGAWASVWYSAIRQIVPRVEDYRLELLFDDDPPYLLVGEWVPYLTVVVTAVLAEHYGVGAMQRMLSSV